MSFWTVGPNLPELEVSWQPLTYRETVLADSPNGYWRLDTLADTAAKAGTLTEVAGPITSVATLLDMDSSVARDLNGSTQYYTAADGTFTDLADVFTLEAWLRVDVLPTPTNVDRLFDKGTNGYAINITETGAFSLAKAGVSVLVTSTATMTVGSTYHVVATKNAGTVKLYLNGVDVTGTVTNATMADTATVLTLGRNATAASNFVDGVIDELAIYPTALTQARVTAHWLAGSQWVDATTFSRGMRIGRGRNDELARFERATADTVLDNRDRRFDPSNTSGPYYPNVKPLRRFRVRARWAGTVYNRFVGFTGDEFPQRYDDTDATVPISCFDGFGALALSQMPVTMTRPAELSGARINALLDECGWPSADRSIATGVAALSAIAAATDMTCLAHLMDVNDAEGGAMFIDRNGVFTFQDRHYRNLSEASSRQTFATVADGENGLHYGDVDVRWGGRLWNGAQVTPASGNVQEWRDTAAQAPPDQGGLYPRVLTKSLPMSSDPEALALAQHIVYLNKAPSLRCYGMRLSGASDPTRLWPALLALEISHHVTVRVTPPAKSGTYTFEQDIEGCEETIEPGEWTMTLPMSPHDTTTYFLIDTHALDSAAVIGY